MKNNTYQFYVLCQNFLTLQPHPEVPTAAQIVEFARTCEGLSWKPEVEGLELLEKCVNRSSEVKDDDVWMDTKNMFIIDAFKDLSSLRDPKAMQLFEQLYRQASFAEKDSNIIWARKVMKRPGGSAVVILHVQDYTTFKRMVEREGGIGDIDSGKMIFA